MRKAIWAAVVTAAIGVGAAYAEPVVYTLTGMGTGVAGSSKCATYQISIDLTVDGKAVKGSFKQQGRPERSFTGTVDDKGVFKTKADLGEGNAMDVTATLTAGQERILVDGYCKFEGKLTRKQ